MIYRSCYYPYFTDECTKAQRGKAIFLRSTVCMWQSKDQREAFGPKVWTLNSQLRTCLSLSEARYSGIQVRYKVKSVSLCFPWGLSNQPHPTFIPVTLFIPTVFFHVPYWNESTSHVYSEHFLKFPMYMGLPTIFFLVICFCVTNYCLAFCTIKQPFGLGQKLEGLGQATCL